MDSIFPEVFCCLRNWNKSNLLHIYEENWKSSQYLEFSKEAKELKIHDSVEKNEWSYVVLTFCQFSGLFAIRDPRFSMFERIYFKNTPMWTCLFVIATLRRYQKAQKALNVPYIATPCSPKYEAQFFHSGLNGKFCKPTRVLYWKSVA